MTASLVYSCLSPSRWYSVVICCAVRHIERRRVGHAAQAKGNPPCWEWAPLYVRACSWSRSAAMNLSSGLATLSGVFPERCVTSTKKPTSAFFDTPT
jgi:hypothetical protein